MLGEQLHWNENFFHLLTKHFISATEHLKYNSLYIVIVSNLNPHRFRWVKDGKLFSEYKSSGTLRAEANLPLEDYNGEYRCYASNSLGTAVSPPARLIVEGGFTRTQMAWPRPQSVLWKQEVAPASYSAASIWWIFVMGTCPQAALKSCLC